MTSTPKQVNTLNNESNIRRALVDRLHEVEKPGRYIGGEWNSIVKNPEDVSARMALAFPDVYEVGMSHLGLKILYAIVNGIPEFSAERVFAPWPDMEKLLRELGAPLSTLETGTPLSSMDVVGFSLQYELCATTVLQMLELGGIPLHASDRTDGDPLVLGGGPNVFNPLPLEPFFDAFAIGDGEDMILDIAAAVNSWKKEGGGRLDLLRKWDSIAGVYVPSLRGDRIISKRIVPDLNEAGFPTRPVIPTCDVVHDRVGLEIARGCTRGCRFCQAGMLYRPVRERRSSAVREMAKQSIDATGWEEISLLSLSTGDYSHIGELVESMAEEMAPHKVSLSLPSLRTESLNERIAEQIKRVRKSGFTLAPEAGTERLRRVINKGNTEEDLHRAVVSAFSAGWKSLKLYFMIGLPGETDEDLNGIIELIIKACKWARGGRITASVSTFVPKPHTPFQWAAQISIDETKRRQTHIRRFLGKYRVKLKFHDARASWLEGVLARGDGRLAPAIELAYKNGARFDGWDDKLRFDTWLRAFEESGIDPDVYLEERTVGRPLPWEFIDIGVAREYLIEEWQKAQAEQPTADCRRGECAGCGICDFETVYPRLDDDPDLGANNTQDVAAPRPDSVRRFRLRFSKTGPARFVGHHDMVTSFQRAFRRAGLMLAHSQGFNPRPKMRFSAPIPLGVESMAEYVDFDLIGYEGSGQDITQRLDQNTPAGLKPTTLEEISLNLQPVSGKIRWQTYEIDVSPILSPQAIDEKIDEFKRSPTFTITDIRKGKARVRNLKDWVRDVEHSGSVVTVRLESRVEGSVNVIAAVSAILGMTIEAARGLSVTKTSVAFE